MKKLLISLALAIGSVVASEAQVITLTATVPSATFSNLYSGAFKVNQIIVTSTNNATGLLVDSITNSTTYVLGAYTNTATYLTNAASYAVSGGPNQYYYTNYYGVVTTVTNTTGTQYIMVDVANTVAASTNTLPSLALSCTTVPTIINSVQWTAIRGLWFTNTGSSTVTLTVTGYRQ